MRTFLSKKYFFKKSKFLLRNRNFNFYEVLGVERNCSNEDIRNAYLKLVKKYHPDVNKSENSDEKFKEITVAYESLNNQVNRDLYDAYMHSDPNSQDGDYDFFKDEKDASFQKEKAKYDEFAESFKKKEKSNFWGGREQREKMEEDVFRNFQSMFNYEFKKKELKGEDLFLEVKISFYESYNGCLKAISIKNKRELCKTCKGSKCLPGFKPNKCLVCAGSGKYKSPLRGVIDCVTCKGKGILIKNFCK